jgi:hypothetical protein
MKYRLIDIEDEESNLGSQPITEEEALSQIRDWNHQMNTYYNSIQDFNDGEEYWQWEEVK